MLLHALSYNLYVRSFHSIQAEDVRPRRAGKRVCLLGEQSPPLSVSGRHVRYIISTPSTAPPRSLELHERAKELAAAARGGDQNLLGHAHGEAGLGVRGLHRMETGGRRGVWVSACTCACVYV